MNTKKHWIVLAVGLVAGWVVLAEVATILAPLALVFGWVPFLARVLPRMTADRGSVAVAGVAIVLFCGGIHWIGRAWRRQREGEAPVGRGWKVRWSLACTVLVLLLFAAGTALVGVLHQVGWLVTSKEPVMVSGIKHHAGSSTNNLRWIGMATNEYCNRPDGLLPPGGTFASDGSMRHSWETYLLPGMIYSTREINLNQPWDSPDNERYFRCILPEFINPNLSGAPLTDDRGFGLSHYSANINVMSGNKRLPFKDLDDAETTILIGEVNTAFQPWGHPVNWRNPALGINRSPHGFGGPLSAGGANFLMADGSVRFVSDRVSPDVMRVLGKADKKGIDPVVLKKEW